MRRLLFLLLICAVVAPAAACGKKGKLDPPDGKQTDYPRQYPR